MTSNGLELKYEEMLAKKEKKNIDPDINESNNLKGFIIDDF